MKKESSEGVFIDLITCALGYVLLLMITQMIQPKAPSWDDKPLVIAAKGDAELECFENKKVYFNWKLQKPDKNYFGNIVEEKKSILPKSEITESGKDMTYVSPDSQLGEWKLYCTVDAKEKFDLQEIPRIIFPKDYEKDFENYENIYKKFITKFLRNDDISPSSLKEIHNELKIFIEKFTVIRTGFEIPKPRYDEKLHFLCIRLFQMNEQILKKMLSFEITAKENSEISKELEYARLEIENYIRIAKLDSLYKKVFRIGLDSDGNVTIPTEDIDKLEKFDLVPNNGESYDMARYGLIAMRISKEEGKSLPVNSSQFPLKKLSEAGKNDTVVLTTLIEHKLLKLEVSYRLNIKLAVMWGDQTGKEEGNIEYHNFAVNAQKLNQSLLLAKIVLKSGQIKPEITTYNNK